MEKMQTEVLHIIRLTLGVKTITLDQKLIEDLKVESADLVVIIAKIEEKFNIVFPENKIADIRTVQDIFDIAIYELNANR